MSAVEGENSSTETLPELGYPSPGQNGKSPLSTDNGDLSASPLPPSPSSADSAISPKSAATDNDSGDASSSETNKPGPKSKPDGSPSASVSAKPKSSKHVRSPSPSPPPPPTRPPLRTIRLEIKLGGPNNYEVNLSALAKETDQRPPTPEPVKRDSSDSEGEAEGGDEGKPQPKKRRVCIHYLEPVCIPSDHTLL